jgi:putative transposase
MEKSTEIRHGRHCIFSLHAHLVFVTKCRGAAFSQSILEDMRGIFAKVCQDFESDLIEFEGQGDHVVFSVRYPPKTPLSKIVNSLKGASSRVLRKRHPELEKSSWNGVLWSPSYFAGSCGGAPMSLVRQYLEAHQVPPRSSL